MLNLFDVKLEMLTNTHTETIQKYFEIDLEIDRLNNVSESFASIDIVCDERKFIEINAVRTL